MSRAYRKEMIKDADNQRYVVKRLRNESLIRDGRTGLTTTIRRDNRATGLREHKQYRARTRVELKGGNDDAVASGKMRRYGDHYGIYEWLTPSGDGATGYPSASASTSVRWRARRPVPCSICWRQDTPITATSQSGPLALTCGNRACSPMVMEMS